MSSCHIEPRGAYFKGERSLFKDVKELESESCRDVVVATIRRITTNKKLLKKANIMKRLGFSPFVQIVVTYFSGFFTTDLVSISSN